MALIVKRHAAVSSPANDGPAGPEAPSREEIARWLGLLAGPDGCIELRALGVTRKGQFGEHAESTFFAPAELDEMAKAARGLSGRARGVYFTLNPVDARLMLSPLGEAAKAKDILARRWMLVDCDPARPDADSSATSAEKEASLAVAKAVRNHLRTKAWPEPILADSGNGAHLLYRIDLPNDDEAKGLLKAALAGLSARFSTDAVHIDTSVYDASRICKLYGTLARKGEPTAERPHRFSRVLDVPSPIQVAGYEWVRDLAGDQGEAKTIPIAAAPGPKGIVAKARPVQDPKRAYAREALNRECDGVATCQAGGRNNRLNQAAFSLGTLIGPDGLTEGEVIAGLAVAAAQAGLAAEEAQRTIQNGINAGKAKPRDMGEIGTAGVNGRARHDGNGGGIRLAIADADGDSPNENDDDPHRLGRIFLKARCHHADGPTLRYWVERWHRWDGAAWRAVPDAEVSAEVTREIKREFDRLVVGTNKPPRPVTTKATSNVIQALKGIVLLTHRECPRQPAWLTDDGPEPLECIAARNGVLHLPSLAEDPRPIPPTPDFFTSNAITYEFDAGAPEPKNWLGFLDSLWDNDPESIASLQEWFGYLLTADTRQQKMLMLIGPTRSGKGTICRVLEAIVGSANVASPTLSSLALNFGVTPLIGKSLAIIPDARLSGRADGQVIIERLLSITGEDTQTIDRKHREDWTGSLRVRFVLGSNELPRLGDSSGAFPGRVILLRLTRSFRDNPDHGLAARILGELPGILLWAIAGWARLRQRGRFSQPASGQELLDELTDLSSPITSFLNDHCQQGSECEVPVKELYEAWKDWSASRGKDHPGDQAGFGRQLRTVIPTLETVQRTVDGARVRAFRGVSLSSRPPPKERYPGAQESPRYPN